MNVDQLLTAFRMIAMGRPNHPEVVAVAEYLAKPSEPLPEIVPEMLPESEDKPKRGRKKAE